MFTYRRLTSCFKSIFVFTLHSGKKKTDCLAVINIKKSCANRIFRNQWIASLIFFEKGSQIRPVHVLIILLYCVEKIGLIILIVSQFFTNSILQVLSYLDVIGASSKNLFLRIFLRCRSYKVLSKIVLIKQLTMNLYPLISWITLSTYRFTQECDCFQSMVIFFYFLSIL